VMVLWKSLYYVAFCTQFDFYGTLFDGPKNYELSS
jgi:hypothetical protein